jgi:hypothetical protein
MERPKCEVLGAVRVYGRQESAIRGNTQKAPSRRRGEAQKLDRIGGFVAVRGLHIRVVDPPDSPVLEYVSRIRASAVLGIAPSRWTAFS